MYMVYIHHKSSINLWSFLNHIVFFFHTDVEIYSVPRLHAFLILSLCFSLQLFALLGFLVSAVLISAAASEVVSLLHMLGVVLSLSNTVLGLTLLAWGNSIGGDIC